MNEHDEFDKIFAARNHWMVPIKDRLEPEALDRLAQVSITAGLPFYTQMAETFAKSIAALEKPFSNLTKAFAGMDLSDIQTSDKG